MKGAKGHHHKRASGGRTDMWVSGNPDVKKEAESKGPYDKGDEPMKAEVNDKKKRGGKVKRRHGGKVEHEMHGHHAKHRGDHPRRARGGGVGADMSPLSSAHRTSSAEKQPREQGGN